ncbi:MAG: response regulator transcription factor [Dehalococcoidales bacterium]|nr:response regulator transcription factor [Dehalococcoidales bacterium]
MTAAKKATILIVDDEQVVIRLLRANLTSSGYNILVAMNGAEALTVVEKELPDLIILDITMPKLDGIKVCQRLREWSQIPIIMLSARSDLIDKVKCLELGADDYVTKPFAKEELLARVSAVLRRTESVQVKPYKPSFSCGEIELNFAERRVTVSGRDVRLTPTEYNLLKELVLNADKVLTHSMLLGRVWGPEYGGEKEYLRVFINRLRKELEPDSVKPKYIVTVPGVGYHFKTRP